MDQASIIWGSDGCTINSFEIIVTNNSQYSIKKIKYKFWIWDEVKQKYHYNSVITSSINLGPYEMSSLPINVPKKRYLYRYKNTDDMSWDKEIIDVEFYKTPEQIRDEKIEEERQKQEQIRLAKESEERERIKQEQLVKDKKRDQLYLEGLNLFKKNNLKEAIVFFNAALNIDSTHLLSLKYKNEINNFFEIRNGNGFKYRNENSNEFNWLILETKKLINEQIDKSPSGEIILSINISFDTLGNNISTVESKMNNELIINIKNLISKEDFKPSRKYECFIKSTDNLNISVKWNSSIEYVVSNGRGINGLDTFFKQQPQDFKDFITKLDYKFGNFTFEVKNKVLKIDEIEYNNQNISLIKYRLNAGPKYALYSLLLPGLGSSKVSSGQRGYLDGLVYLASLTSSGIFKLLEKSKYSDYQNSINPTVIEESYSAANSNRKLFLISLGLAGVMYVYDFSWALANGFGNIKKSSTIKKKLKSQSIEVKTSKF
jgi:hypothetical protein